MTSREGVFKLQFSDARFFYYQPTIYAFLKFKVAAKLGDVTLRRSAEKLFVLAAKVRWVFIAHTKPGARGVQVFADNIPSSAMPRPQACVAPQIRSFR